MFRPAQHKEPYSEGCIITMHMYMHVYCERRAEHGHRQAQFTYGIEYQTLCRHKNTERGSTSIQINSAGAQWALIKVQETLHSEGQAKLHAAGICIRNQLRVRPTFARCARMANMLSPAAGFSLGVTCC